MIAEHLSTDGSVDLIELSMGHRSSNPAVKPLDLHPAVSRNGRHGRKRPLLTGQPDVIDHEKHTQLRYVYIYISHLHYIHTYHTVMARNTSCKSVSHQNHYSF